MQIYSLYLRFLPYSPINGKIKSVLFFLFLEKRYFCIAYINKNMGLQKEKSINRIKAVLAEKEKEEQMVGGTT